jgi:hypothetical protein
VTGLTVSIGGGSGEVIPEWDRAAETDINHYVIWYSLQPGDAKTELATVAHDPGALDPPAYNAGSGRTAYVDFPRQQTMGFECYQVSAFDAAGQEGPRSPEVCLPNDAPVAVTGFSVGIGGGSGEVFIQWNRNGAPDLDHYNLWYSELPGQDKTLLDAVAHGTGALSGPAYDVGGGVTGYIDFPRDLANDKQCYQLSAVDVGGLEGPRTGELCLADL